MDDDSVTDGVSEGELVGAFKTVNSPTLIILKLKVLLTNVSLSQYPDGNGLSTLSKSSSLLPSLNI